MSCVCYLFFSIFLSDIAMVNMTLRCVEGPSAHVANLMIVKLPFWEIPLTSILIYQIMNFGILINAI